MITINLRFFSLGTDDNCIGGSVKILGKELDYLIAHFTAANNERFLDIFVLFFITILSRCDPFFPLFFKLAKMLRS